MLGLRTRLLLALVAGTAGLVVVPIHGRFIGLVVAVGLVLVGRIILTASGLFEDGSKDDIDDDQYG